MKGKIWILAILILVAANASALSTDYNTNMKAYWGLQGNLMGNNVSGAGNLTKHYTPSNKTGADCVIGECMAFDGSFGDDYMSAVDDYLHGKNVTTISFWTYRTLYGEWDNRFSLGNDKDRIGDGGDSTIVNFVVSGSGSIMNATYQILNDSANGVWEHYVMTSDGSRFRVYVNGVLKINETQGGPWDGDGTIYFATRFNTSSEWGGRIDEIGIWHQSFTTAMAVEIYNSSNGVPYEVLAASGSGAIAWTEEPVNLSYKSNKTLGVQYNATGADTFWDNSYYFDVNATGFLTERYDLLNGNYTLNISVNDSSNNIATKEITIEIKMPLTAYSWDATDGLVSYLGTGNSTILLDNHSTNDGTVNGARSVECVLGNCYDIRKSGERIVFGTQTINGAFSISGWVYFHQWETGTGGHIRQEIFYNQNGYYYAAGTKGFWISQEYNDFGIRIDNGTHAEEAETSDIDYSNQLLHFIGIYTGTELLFYLNGNLVDNQSATIPLSFNISQTFVISSNQYEHNGTIDEVFIWNRILTQTEISLLANKTPYYEMPTQDAIAGYDFQNGTEDVTGNDNDGTNNGAYHVKAVEGMQYRYDGVDDRIFIENSAHQIDDLNLFSISIWGKYDSVNQMDLISFNDDDSSGYLSLYKLNSNMTRFIINNGSSTDYGNMDYIHNQHINQFVGIYNGTHKLGYLNGILKYSTEFQFNNFEDIHIGHLFLGWWNGTIDEVAIWNRSLTASEVKELYLLTGYDHILASDSADTTPPTWTQEPQNKTFNLGESIGIQFNATDNVAIDSFYSSTFGIEYFSMNSTGYLTNITGLAAANFHFTLYVNDTSNNTISKYVKFTIIDNCTSSWSNSTVSQAVYQSCNSSSKMVYNTTLLWTDANGCNSSYNTYILNESSCNSYTCDWAKTGLISSWSDGNATVFEDNHSTNDGTVIGARHVECASGGCYDFDVIDDYIESSIIINPNSSTSCAWFFVSGGTDESSQNIITLYDTDGTHEIYRLIRSDTTGRLIIQGDYDLYLESYGLPLSLNEKHHACISINSTHGSLYIDGELLNSDTTWNSMPESTAFRIGRVAQNFYEWNGTIDEVTIWNRSLSTSEVQDVYNNDSARAYGTWESSLKSGVVAHYALDNNSAEDVATGQNNGTVNGATPVECASGGCYNLDYSNNNYIDLTNNIAFTSNMTISYWIYHNQIISPSIYYTHISTNYSNDRIYVKSDGVMGFRTGINNEYNDIQLSLNKLTNIVFVIENSTNALLYMNNIKSSILRNLTFNNQWINSFGKVINSMNGTIDEVSIWNRSLNATEVKNLYNVRSLPTCTVLGVCTPSLANTTTLTTRIQICNVSNVSVWQNQTIEYDANSCGGANTTYLINYTKTCTYNVSVPSNVSYTGERLACEQNRSCCYDVAGNVDTLCWVDMDWDDCLTEANTTGFCPEALYEYDAGSTTYPELFKMKNFGSDFHVSAGGSEDTAKGGVFGQVYWRSYKTNPHGLRMSGGTLRDIYCNAWKCMSATDYDAAIKFRVESEGFVWEDKYVGWTAAKCYDDSDDCTASPAGNQDGINLQWVDMPTSNVQIVDGADYDCDDCLIIEYTKDYMYSKWEGTLTPTFLLAVHPAPIYYTGVGSSSTVNLYWNASNNEVVNITFGAFRKDNSDDLNQWIQNVSTYHDREQEVKKWTYDFYSAFNKPTGYSNQNKTDYYWGVNTYETSTLGCFNDSDTTSTYYVDGHCAEVHIPTMEFYPAMWPWDSSNSAAGLLVAINYSHDNASFVLNRTVADWLRVWTEHSAKYPSESAWYPGLGEHYQETNLQHHAGWPLVALNLYNRTEAGGYPLITKSYYCNNVSRVLRSHYEYIKSNKDIDNDGLTTLGAVQHGRDGTQAQYSVVENAESTLWQVMAALSLRELYEHCGNTSMAEDMADDYTQIKTNFEGFWNSSCNGGGGCYWNPSDNSGTFYNWGAGNKDMATTAFTSILAPALLNGTQARAEYLVTNLSHYNFTDTYAYTSLSTNHPCYSPTSAHIGDTNYCADGETWDGAIWGGVDNFWAYQAMLDMISRRGFALSSEKDWLCANNFALFGLEGSTIRTPYAAESYNPLTGSVTDTTLWATNPFGWGANIPTMCVSDTNLFSLLDLGESEPDTTPPGFYGVTNTSTDHDSTFIQWNTTEPANSTVCYGTSLALGSCTGNVAYVEPHSILLTGLTNNTLYYYNLTSCDISHNCNSSGIYNFTTGSTPPISTYNWSDIYSSVMLWYHDGKGFAHWNIDDQMYYDQPAYVHSLLNRYEDTQNSTYLNLSAWIVKNVTGEYDNWGLSGDDFQLWHIGGLMMHFARHAKASGIPKYMELANETTDFVIANISNPGLTYLKNWTIDGVEMAILTEASGTRAKPLNQNYGCALMNVYLYNVTGNVTYNTTATRMANAFMYASGNETCEYDTSERCFTYSYRYDFDQPWEDYTGYTWGFPPHREEKHYLVQDFEALYTLWHYGFVGNATIQMIGNAIHDNMIPHEGHFDNVLIGYQLESPPASNSTYNKFYSTHWVDAIGYYSPWNTNITNITESVLRHVYDFVNDGDGTYTFGGHPYGNLTDPRTGQLSEYVPDNPTDGEKADVLISHFLKSISTHLYPNKGSALTLYSGDIVDRINPNWTQEPGNISIQDNESLAVQINATDNEGIDTFSVNNTDFSINSSGYLTNNTGLSIQNYTINISVNDTTGNILSQVITIEVTNSSVADTTPPTIANVTNSSITNVSVTIAWDLTEAGNGTLSYGNTSALGTTVTNASFILIHSFDISGLLPNTTYHYNVTSCDASGNCNTSGGLNFSTLANTVDNNSPIISGIGSSVTATSGTITWTTNETSNSTVNYGPTSALGTTVGSASLVTSHSVLIPGLSASTIYYYNVTSCDYFGNCQENGTYSFTTSEAGGGGGGGSGSGIEVEENETENTSSSYGVCDISIYPKTINIDDDQAAETITIENNEDSRIRFKLKVTKSVDNVSIPGAWDISAPEGIIRVPDNFVYIDSGEEADTIVEHIDPIWKYANVTTTAYLRIDSDECGEILVPIKVNLTEPEVITLSPRNLLATLFSPVLPYLPFLKVYYIVILVTILMTALLWDSYKEAFRKRIIRVFGLMLLEAIIVIVVSTAIVLLLRLILG